MVSISCFPGAIEEPIRNRIGIHSTTLFASSQYLLSPNSLLPILSVSSCPGLIGERHRE